MLTPTPGWNTTALSTPSNRTTHHPARHSNPASGIPDFPLGAQFLAGIGAGSWFILTPCGAADRSEHAPPSASSSMARDIDVRRFSPGGALECQGRFSLLNVEPTRGSNTSGLDFKAPFEITFPSHCALVTVLQDDCRMTFERTLLHRNPPASVDDQELL